MTTSGTTSLGYTVNEIFTEALDDLGIIGDGETLSGNHFSRCKRAANMILGQWKAQGNHLWTKTEGYLFCTKGTNSYNFSSARLVNSYTKTTTSAASSSGGSTITLTSVTGVSNTDIIGVLLDDDTMQWTTVNGAPVGSVVTLTAALTGDVNSGATVFHYDASQTFKAAERIRQVRRIDDSDYEIPLNMYSRSEYMGLPNKDEQSIPVVAYADRQRDAIVLYLWNTPNASDIVIPFTYERKIEVVTDAAETWDIPEYWFNALTLAIAVRVAPRFGVNPVRLQKLEEYAVDAYDTALTFDTEITDLKFTI